MPEGLNERYVDNYPTAEAAFALFSGDWVSIVPGGGELGGVSDLFQDPRISWLLSKLSNISEMEVLELGPLEGAHSYMLAKAGAKSILSIEANTTAFMRSLMVKNAFNLGEVKFLLGDFVKFVAAPPKSFDLIVASGVLYHLIDPLPFLIGLMAMSNKIFLWSHFFDERAMPVTDPRRQVFNREQTVRTIGDQRLSYWGRSYGDASASRRFCGGIADGTTWLDKAEVVHLLETNGFRVEVSFDHPSHAAGPACCILAERLV